MNVTRVRCYAGASYPERPITFEWEGAWLEVTEVLRQARPPEGLVFRVVAENDQEYELVWIAANDSWWVKAMACDSNRRRLY